MKQFPRIAIYAFLLSGAALCWLSQQGWAVEEAYRKLQGSLFTGFLTIGGFLLTLKTFILVQLREKLYDSDAYKAHYERMKALGASASRYEPLKNLGNFLLYSVIFSICTSIAHISVGFIPCEYAAVFCLALSFCTLALVVRAWLAIRKSLNTWFQHMEDKSGASLYGTQTNQPSSEPPLVAGQKPFPHASPVSDPIKAGKGAQV